MDNIRLTFVAALTSVATLGFGSAWAADWRIVEVSGVVRVAAPGRDAASAVPNQTLPAGATVTTAGGGRAALFNGAQRITLGPNSRMTVAPDPGPGITRVMQDLGSILFQVDKKPSQHFRVETPLLAAIVKGTTFTVNVELNASSVHVAEGLVEVRANQGGATKDVGAGATGRIARDAPAQLSVLAPGAATFDAAEVSVAALDYTAVTGGLVEGPAAPGATGGEVVSGQRIPNMPTDVVGLEQAAGVNGSGNRTVAAVVLAAFTPPDIGSASGVNNASGGNPDAGSGNANGDAGTGTGNSSAGGNGNAGANSNGNAGGNGNSGGDPGASGNSSAGGNANAGANSNAGGNGNGNAPGANPGGGVGGGAGNGNVGGGNSNGGGKKN